MTKEQRDGLAAVNQQLGVYTAPTKTEKAGIYPGFYSAVDQLDIKMLHFDGYGYLWGAGFGGVIRWSISDRIAYEVWQATHGLADGDILSFLFVSQNNIFCGHYSGWISQFNGEIWEKVANPTQFPVRSLALSPDNEIVAGQMPDFIF